MGEVLSSLGSLSRIDTSGGWRPLNSTPLTESEVDALAMMPRAVSLLRDFRVEVVGGIVQVMGGPSQEHAGVSRAIDGAVLIFFSTLPVPIWLKRRGDGEVRIGGVDRRHPDEQWSAAGVAAADHPRVVLEVNMRETYGELMARKDMWFTAPQVQMVLLAHIYNGSHRFEVWQRGAGGAPAAAATAACEFGGGACALHAGVGRVVGLGQHVVPIPTAPFFAPPVIAPAGTPAHILVDIWLVQQVLI